MNELKLPDVGDIEVEGPGGPEPYGLVAVLYVGAIWSVAAGVNYAAFVNSVLGLYVVLIADVEIAATE